jgi:hypothetical protein
VGTQQGIIRIAPSPLSNPCPRGYPIGYYSNPTLSAVHSLPPWVPNRALFESHPLRCPFPATVGTQKDIFESHPLRCPFPATVGTQKGIIRIPPSPLSIPCHRGYPKGYYSNPTLSAVDSLPPWVPKRVLFESHPLRCRFTTPMGTRKGIIRIPPSPLSIPYPHGYPKGYY